MKKTFKSEKVLTFLSNNVGLVGLLTILNFLLIYLLFDKLQSTEQRLMRIESATIKVVSDMNDMSKPIVEDEVPAKK